MKRILNSDSAEEKVCLSPKKFLKLIQSDRQIITSSKFIAPELGDPHFGKFIVKIKREPVYER